MNKKIKLYMLDLSSVRIVLIFTVLICLILGCFLFEEFNFIFIGGTILFLLLMFGLMLFLQNLMSNYNKIRYISFEKEGMILYYFDKSTQLIPYADIKSVLISDKYGYTKTLVMSSFSLFISVITEDSVIEVYSDVLGSNVKILQFAKEKNLKIDFNSVECKSFFEKRL